MDKYFVLQVLVGRNGTHILHQQSTKWRGDVPFSAKSDAIDLARGMYNGLSPTDPAEDFYVVDGGGQVVWSHPQNKQEFTGQANMEHLI